MLPVESVLPHLLEVLANNAPAIQLYESMGFVTERMDQDRHALVMVRARRP